MEYNPPNLEVPYSLENGFAGKPGVIKRPALGLEGRFYAIPNDQAGLVRIDTLRSLEKQWDEMSRTGFGIPHEQVGEMRGKIPELRKLTHLQIVKEISIEYGQFSDMMEARKCGNYVEYEKDGRTQRGIVRKQADGSESREGLWLEKDSHNRIRKCGVFQNGKPHGDFREYRDNGSLERITRYDHGRKNGIEENFNGRSEVVRRTEYLDDRIIKDQAVDPQAEKLRETKSKQMGRVLMAFRR